MVSGPNFGREIRSRGDDELGWVCGEGGGDRLGSGNGDGLRCCGSKGSDRAAVAVSDWAAAIDSVAVKWDIAVIISDVTAAKSSDVQAAINSDRGVTVISDVRGSSGLATEP
jgi:hypothetical protein